MVLPDRIELSTSPLPRECSTTELRQRRIKRGGPRTRRKLPQGVRLRKEKSPLSVANPFFPMERETSLRPCGCRARRLRKTMTTPRQEQPPRPVQKPGRKERLAAQLRANLK